MPNEEEPAEDQQEREVEGEDEIIGDRSVDVPVRRGPVIPTAGEVEAHKLTGHAIYRSWCTECVKGSRQNAPHLSSTAKGPHE
eukprot:8903790-Karenia_brevis.AAC.1